MISSNLQHLPSELIMSILELALVNVKPSILATISRTVRLHLNEVLYRTIILSSPQIVRALHRTAVTSPHLLLLVKKLVSAYDYQELQDPFVNLHTELGDIIGACKHLHALTLRDLSPLPKLAEHHYLEEISVHSFMDNGTKGLQTGSSVLRRLRFAEPNEDGWVPPSEMLAALGDPKGLTHLQLSRRAGANEGNDNAFRDDIVTVLENQRELKVLVVSLYTGYSWQTDGSPIEESHLWRIIADLKKVDGRIALLEGQRSDWRKEHETFQPGDHINSRFWAQL